MWLLVIILFFQSNPVLASSPVDLEFLLNSLREFRSAEDKAHCKNIHIHSEDKNKSSFWELGDENEELWQEPSED